MEKDLCKFIDNVEIKNKDLAIYEDGKGNRFVFNTINAIVRVDYLELTKEEYQVAKFQQKVEDLDYTIENVKRPVPKSEITGKQEDKNILVDKEVAVRKIWNVSNPYGAIKSFTNKEEAIKLCNLINEKILKYFD
jgi:hypothetical protein